MVPFTAEALKAAPAKAPHACCCCSPSSPWTLRSPLGARALVDGALVHPTPALGCGQDTGRPFPRSLCRHCMHTHTCTHTHTHALTLTHTCTPSSSQVSHLGSRLNQTTWFPLLLSLIPCHRVTKVAGHSEHQTALPVLLFSLLSSPRTQQRTAGAACSLRRPHSLLLLPPTADRPGLRPERSHGGWWQPGQGLGGTLAQGLCPEMLHTASPTNIFPLQGGPWTLKLQTMLFH